MATAIDTTDGPSIDLNAFQRDLLYAIAGLDEPIGLDVKQALEAAGYGDVAHARLYPNIDTLADKGLVEREKRDGRSKIVRITPRGRNEAQAHHSWEADCLEGTA